MQVARMFLSLVVLVSGLALVPGCGGSKDATVAPRSAEEVEAYKAEVYAAEEEDAASQEE